MQSWLPGAAKGSSHKSQHPAPQYGFCFPYLLQGSNDENLGSEGKKPWARSVRLLSHETWPQAPTYTLWVLQHQMRLIPPFLLSGAPFDPPIRISALHDSLIEKIEDPFLPTTRPIFPGGTSSTDKISSSKVSLSAFRNSGIEGIDGQSAYSSSLMQKHRQQSKPQTASLHNDCSNSISLSSYGIYMEEIEHHQ